MEIASDIALNHHERWDGKCYNGFAGQNISLYSRIMAIADVFDALVSKRSYKDKWLPEDAYNEIVSQSGNQNMMPLKGKENGQGNQIFEIPHQGNLLSKLRIKYIHHAKANLHVNQLSRHLHRLQKQGCHKSSG